MLPLTNYFSTKRRIMVQTFKRFTKSMAPVSVYTNKCFASILSTPIHKIQCCNFVLQVSTGNSLLAFVFAVTRIFRILDIFTVWLKYTMEIFAFICIQIYSEYSQFSVSVPSILSKLFAFICIQSFKDIQHTRYFRSLPRVGKSFFSFVFAVSSLFSLDIIFSAGSLSQS